MTIPLRLRYRARLLTACLVCLLFTACAGLGGYREPPRVSLVGIQPLDMTLMEQRYRLALRILNPNDVDLPVSGMNYSVELNGREFAYGVSRQEVTIPALGEAVVEVEVISSLLDMLRQLRALEDDTARGLDYRLVGDLRLGDHGVRLPFEYSGSLDWVPPSDAASPD